VKILMDERDDIPEEMIDRLKRHKPNMTVKCHIGIDIGHMKGVKAMYLGSKKIWDNPDYQEGGIFYEDTNRG